MSDKFLNIVANATNPSGTSKRLKDMNDGTVAEAITQVGGPILTQGVTDFPSVNELAAAFNTFAGVAPTDVLTRKVTTNGQVIMCLSASPLTENTESVIQMTTPIPQPCALEIEASISQRIRQQYTTVGLIFDGSIPQPDPIEIVSLYQSTATDGAAYNATAGTVLTITLKTTLPDGYYVSDWVDVYGLVDNRLNYPNLCIRWISTDRKTIVGGFSDESALPSLAVTYTPPAASAFVRLRRDFGTASDAIGMRFGGTNASLAAYLTMFAGSDMQCSGTAQGDQRVTSGSSAPIYNIAANGQVELRATNRFRFETSPRDAVWFDRTSDTTNLWTSRVASRTSVRPHGGRSLVPQFRLVNPKSMTRPIARIKSISKSGSTTWNIQTMEPHGLVTGNYVTVKGVRDQVNFANFATPVTVTVVDETNFTLIGTTGTATSRGGCIILTNGGLDQQGLLGQTIQSVVWDNTLKTLTLTGSANWSTGVGVMNVADYVHLYGCVDTAGNDIGIDGVWEVLNITTTALTLVPVYDILNNLKSPVVTSLSTNCGGVVIHRTTLRSHDFNMEYWSESITKIDGQGTTRYDKAVPVNMLGGTISSLQAISAGTNLIGDVGEQLRATSTGAATISSILSPATPAAASIKAAAGRIAGYYFKNTSASLRSVKFFDATTVTLGTTSAKCEIDLNPGDTAFLPIGAVGMAFGTGIQWAVTAAKGLTDNTATGLAVNDVSGWIGWA